MNKETPMIGWFSEKQAAIAGTHIYSTPDGEEVEVSMISETEDHGAGPDDIVCRGPVAKWVRQGRRVPSCDFSTLTRLLRDYRASSPRAYDLTLKAAFVPTQFEPQFGISISPDALARLEEENRAAREAGEVEPYVFLEMAMTSDGTIHRTGGVRSEDIVIDDSEVSPARVEQFKRETWDPLIRNLAERRKAP